MSDSESPEAVIKQKLAELLDRRKAVRHSMTALAMQDRDIDREIADLRAAARVFGIRLALPEDEERPRVRYLTLPDGTEVRRRISPDGRIMSETTVARSPSISSTPVPTPPPPPAIEPITKRPPIREIVLDRLKTAGKEGTSAAALRRYIERVYNTEIHEKTAGMTLYRLAQDGKVQRKGRTWFFVPPEAETENPGVDAPGLDKSSE